MKRNNRAVKLNKGLKIKMIMLFTVLISVPLMLLGMVSSTLASKALRDVLENEMSNVAINVVEKTNQDILASRMLVEVMSQNLLLAKAAQGDTVIETEAFKTLMETHKRTDQIIESFIITDEKGMIEMNHKWMAAEGDLSQYAFVQQALEGEASTSSVIVSPLSNEHVVAVAYPLKRGVTIVGTLIGTIRVETLAESIAHVKIGDEGYGFLVDREGLLLYHPDETLAMTEKIDNLGIKGFDDVINNMKVGGTGNGRYIYGGVDKYIYYMPLGEWTLAITAGYDEYMATAITIRQIMFIAVIVTLVLAIALAYLFTNKGIVKPIKDLEDMMKVAGEGDLRLRSDIKTGDEIESLGKHFNIMMEDQAGIICNVRSGVDDLTVSSNDIASASEEISEATMQIASNIARVADYANNQNDKIAEISEVLVQLSNLIQVAQKRAKGAHSNVNQAYSVANAGRVSVQNTVDTIQSISDSTDHTAQKLTHLNKLSNQVSGIVTTINAIASQTNLLALNANIEAARAGEHGRGFSVVADEVRKLAEETDKESAEISKVVNEMVQEIESAVLSMRVGKEAVSQGIVVADETDQSFVSIIKAFESIVNDIEGIVDTTKEEVSSSKQILELIDGVASITAMTAVDSEAVAQAAEEQNGAVQYMTASAEESLAMANTLAELVETFTI